MKSYYYENLNPSLLEIIIDVEWLILTMMSFYNNLTNMHIIVLYRYGSISNKTLEIVIAFINDLHPRCTYVGVKTLCLIDRKICFLE